MIKTNMLKLYNSLSRKKETFKPLKKKNVGLYTCGPTVYGYAHIGNLRTYIFEDILKRVLEYNGYTVKHVMNITDVGHLTSDSDTGEDKMEKGAKRENKTVWEIADFYTKEFQKDAKLLNIKDPTLWIKATDTIQDQIDLIKILEKKGFTYQIADGIYFNSSKLKTYGRLWPKKMSLKAGARVEMVEGKKSPNDFALWKFSNPNEKRQMEWDSPWGKGFPGWHTECVAMAVKNLGKPFDIHCGGIDHLLIHHTNEIAQAEAAYKKPLAKLWMHGEFLILDKGKMAKSEGNIVLVKNLEEKGFSPLAYRYLCLTTHYRSKLSFSWENMTAGKNALNNISNFVSDFPENIPASAYKSKVFKKYQKEFLKLINDDLNIPKALALMWEVIKSLKISKEEKSVIVANFDNVLGLDILKERKEIIPAEVLRLAEEREYCRKNKEWKKSDEIRAEVKKMGYLIEDTDQGPKIRNLSI